MKLTVLGIPQPKQSARFRSVKMGEKTFVKSYQKKEVIENQQNIAYDIKRQLPEAFIPLTDALKVRMVFVFPPLSSWNKKMQNEFVTGATIYKDKKPDLDNICKTTMDAMQGVVFINDSQVVDLHCTKIFGPVPMTEITITSLK